MDLNANKSSLIKIIASSFVLIIGIVIIIIWAWPSSPPQFIKSFEFATPAGIEITQLTSNSFIKQDLAWSPDGKYLAYVKWYNPEIYLIDVANQTESQLTHWNGWGNSGLGFLGYSDDGLELFLGTNGNIWIQPINGSEPQSIIPPNLPSWWISGYQASFTKDKCAFFVGTYPVELYLIDLNTGDHSLLVGDLEDGRAIAFCPDGKSLVYYAAIMGQHDPQHINMPLRHVWIINTDGTGQILLVDEYSGNLCWSPDGSKIAYLYDNKLCQINPDGTGQEETPLQGGNILNFAWSPDGKKISYWSSPSNWDYGQALWILNLESGSQECILNLENVGVYWGKKGMAWSPDSDSIAFILSRAWATDITSVSGEAQVFMLTLNTSNSY